MLLSSESVTGKETIAERAKMAMDARGLKKNQVETRAGFGNGYMSNLFERNSDNLRPNTLKRLAEALEVNLGWLTSGEGESGLPGLGESTPLTPPANSGTRPRGERVERDDVEYVDAWFFEALQKLQGRRRYTTPQAHAAKRFLVWGSNKLQDGDPYKMVLGALEAAKELDETGQTMTPEKIFALLIEKNAPPSGPEPGARQHDAALEFTKDLIRKESKRALKNFTPKERKPRD